jgi:ABC-type transport system involved in cytochrome c biogenesis permease subunit
LGRVACFAILAIEGIPQDRTAWARPLGNLLQRRYRETDSMMALLWLTAGLYGTSLVGAGLAAVNHRAGPERFSRYALFAAFGLHSVLLLLRTAEAGRAPMMGRYETLLFFAWSLALLNLVLILRYRYRQTEFLTVPVIVAALGFAALSGAALYPTPLILKTWWFETHVVTAFFAYALFSLAAAGGAISLLRTGRSRQASLGLLPVVIRRAMLWGFVFFSASMVLGAIWGYLAWGAYWQWEPKSTASLLLWFYFAGALHTRYATGWRGWPTALLAVIGFGLVLFTYLGVGIFFENSHRM